MCVIAIKPKNRLIDFETIEEMFFSNPHGAGLAVVIGKQCIVSKGYMDVQDLWSDVSQLQDLDLVIHFRWATHGMINHEMCHPFIVDKEEAICTQVYAETDSPVLIHNGVLPSYGNKRISDTCDFTMNNLAFLDSTLSRIKALKLLSSKFVLIDHGKILKIGDFKKYKGLHVSNLDFIQYYKKGFKTYDNVFIREISNCDNLWENADPLLSRTTCSRKNKR